MSGAIPPLLICLCSVDRNRLYFCVDAYMRYCLHRQRISLKRLSERKIRQSVGVKETITRMFVCLMAGKAIKRMGVNALCGDCPIGSVVEVYRGADKPLAGPGRKQAKATEDFDFLILFIIIIGGILVLYIYIYIYIYISRLVSKEIFSPSNKIHREVGGAKDLAAPLNIRRVFCY